MCTGVEVAIMAGTAISAGSSYQKGREAKALAGYQADQARADADAEKGAAQVYADKIRKAGNAERSKMTAAMAASGATAGSQSAEDMDRSTVSAYEEDALVSLYGGEGSARRRLAQAQAYEISGSRAERYALAEAAATGMSGWYRARQYSLPNISTKPASTGVGTGKTRTPDWPAYDASVGGY